MLGDEGPLLLDPGPVGSGEPTPLQVQDRVGCSLGDIEEFLSASARGVGVLRVSYDVEHFLAAVQSGRVGVK